MIIDSPINFALGSGQDRIIPEEDDARIRIPNQIVPTINAIQPLQIGQSADSGLRRVFSTYVQRTVLQGPSTASQQLGLLTLGKGLWEVQCELSHQVDFGGTAAAPLFVALSLSYQSQSLSLMNVPLVAAQGGILITTYRMLLVSDAVLLLQTATTAAAQNLMMRVTVNASKVL